MTRIGASRPPDPADETLMLRYQQGDRAAFAQLVRRHQTALYNFALRQVRVPQVAEDIAQESCVRGSFAGLFDTGPGSERAPGSPPGLSALGPPLALVPLGRAALGTAPPP